MGSLWRVMWSSSSFGFAWVGLATPRGRWVHLGSRGFTQGALGVVAFIRVRLGSHGRSLRFHSGSGGFTCALLSVTELIRVSVDSLRRTLMSPASFGLACRSGQVVVPFIHVRLG